LLPSSSLPAVACCEQHGTAIHATLHRTAACLLQIAGRFWADAVDAYKAGNLAGLRASGSALLALLSDMDQLLGSHKAFLLGPVLQRARDYAGSSSSSESAVAAAAAAAGEEGLAADDVELLPDARQLHKSSSVGSTDSGRSSESNSTAADPAAVACSAAVDEQQQRLAALYDWNMRTQLTIWGTSAVAGDSEVSDYANKEWSGLIASFYLPRWQAWLARLEQDLLQARPYDAAAWRLEVLMMTYRWISSGSTRSMQPEPMAVDAAAGATADSDLVFTAGDAPAIAELALVPCGDAVQMSKAAYERYGRLLAPGCSATAATAAAAVAAAAAGLAAAAAVPAGAPAGTVVAAAAAAAVVVGAAGAAAAAAAAAASGPLPAAVDAAKA
jgi:hypothetical protein